jgi:hypothetical protein
MQDPTNLLNNGAGDINELLNSGCACVATKNGWSFNSINSTNLPSGLNPESINPFSCNIL